MIFRQMLNQCGLKRQEAADYFGYSLESVKKWIKAERPVPDEVLTKLAGLNKQINDIADLIADIMAKSNTTISGRTIEMIRSDYPSLSVLPVDSAKDACTARAVLIVAAEQMKKKSKTPQ